MSFERLGAGFQKGSSLSMEMMKIQAMSNKKGR
jgi:hypothetical protein